MMGSKLLCLTDKPDVAVWNNTVRTPNTNKGRVRIGPLAQHLMREKIKIRSLILLDDNSAFFEAISLNLIFSILKKNSEYIMILKYWESD